MKKSDDTNETNETVKYKYKMFEAANKALNLSLTEDELLEMTKQVKIFNENGK